MGSLGSDTDNSNVSVASLETIDFAALENKDPNEVDKLMQATMDTGFFYLDFGNSGAKNLPESKKELLKVMDSYFLQPTKTKMANSRGISTRGYVAKGTFSAVHREKPKESFEHFAISTYELQKDAKSVLPVRFQEAGSLVPDYIRTCEDVVDVMLSRISEALKLVGDTHLHKDHLHDRPSETILALLSYPGQLTHQKHTDLGSLTVLFSDQWGLQVIAPQTGQWEWVEPRENHAVINVGDTLRFLTGKKLYSCIHRVVRDGRASDQGHRYSIAYLLRPDNEAVFHNAEGVQITAGEFMGTKYQSYRAPHKEQEGSTVLTGGMEETLGVRVAE